MKLSGEIIIVLLLLINSIKSDDFCKVEKEHCAGLKHVGCNKENAAKEDNSTCIYTKPITLSQADKDVTLRKLNELRNKTAAGLAVKRDIPGNEILLKSASRMRELHWDDSLERLAILVIESCYIDSNGNKTEQVCTATERFPNAGYIDFVSNKTRFEGNMKTGSDKSNRVGCAYRQLKLTSNYRFVCIFNVDNANDSAWYLHGEALTKCSDFNDKNSTNYKYLCDGFGHNSAFVMKFSFGLFVILALIQFFV